MMPCVSRLYYVHDPMCSWCWGFRPVWQKLLAQLPPHLSVLYILGGLAPDTEAPMPAYMQHKIHATWEHIHATLGTPFNFDFWRLCQPRRDTYKACRAVIAAKKQQQEQPMILAIQQAYYMHAMNPSDTETLIRLAEALPMYHARFVYDLTASDTEQLLQQDIGFAQTLPIRGFPSLVLENKTGHFLIAIDYQSPNSMLAAISAICSR